MRIERPNRNINGTLTKLLGRPALRRLCSRHLGQVLQKLVAKPTQVVKEKGDSHQEPELTAYVRFPKCHAMNRSMSLIIALLLSGRRQTRRAT